MSLAEQMREQAFRYQAVAKELLSAAQNMEKLEASLLAAPAKEPRQKAFRDSKHGRDRTGRRSASVISRVLEVLKAKGKATHVDEIAAALGMSDTPSKNKLRKNIEQALKRKDQVIKKTAPATYRST